MFLEGRDREREREKEKERERERERERKRETVREKERGRERIHLATTLTILGCLTNFKSRCHLQKLLNNILLYLPYLSAVGGKFE